MQHVGARRAGNIGAVVDREKRAMAPGGVGEHLERGQFGARFERAQPLLTDRTLVPQLDDVDSAGQRGVGELGKVTAFTPGIGAQIQLGRA